MQDLDQRPLRDLVLKTSTANSCLPLSRATKGSCETGGERKEGAQSSSAQSWATRRSHWGSLQMACLMQSPNLPLSPQPEPHKAGA